MGRESASVMGARRACLDTRERESDARASMLYLGMLSGGYHKVDNAEWDHIWAIISEVEWTSKWRHNWWQIGRRFQAMPEDPSPLHAL